MRVQRVPNHRRRHGRHSTLRPHDRGVQRALRYPGGNVIKLFWP
jgi:hypothetical protein